MYLMVCKAYIQEKDNVNKGSLKKDKIWGEIPNPNDLQLILKIVIAYLGIEDHEMDVKRICWGYCNLWFIVIRSIP